MTNLNKELIERLANGDSEAHKELKSLPPVLMMNYGIAVRDFQELQAVNNATGEGSDANSTNSTNSNVFISSEQIKESMDKLYK